MDRTITEGTCRRFGVDAVVPDAASTLGIALKTLARLPINGVRLAPGGGTCGWYVWGGGDIGPEDDFFQPLHVAHLDRYCPVVLPYLGLPPGWRFQVAPGHEDVWFEPVP